MYTPLRQFCLQWLREKADHHGGDILNIGSRTDYYNYRKMFYLATKFRNVDIIDGPGVDITCDAANMTMIPDKSIDTIIAVFMLYGPQSVIPLLDEFKRVLKPGGGLLCTYQPLDVPFYLLNHGAPKVRVNDGGRWKVDEVTISGLYAKRLIEERFTLKETQTYKEQNRTWLFMEAETN